MFRVIILYAPDEETILETAKNIKAAFNNEKCETAVKAAKNALIPDIAASDIVILGSKTEGKKPVHSDFKEIIRALHGINLAGRIAGFFSFGLDATITSFKEALLDSDITIYKDNLLIKDGQNNSSEISIWVKKLIVYHKEGT
ncbi:MAG: flavodoxin family protein [Spirochaetales bacterium]|nr:flavodoxin family protein [Spirochaetales bacterium]